MAHILKLVQDDRPDYAFCQPLYDGATQSCWLHVGKRSLKQTLHLFVTRVVFVWGKRSVMPKQRNGPRGSYLVSEFPVAAHSTIFPAAAR